MKNVNPDTQNDGLKIMIYDQTRTTLYGATDPLKFTDENWHHLGLDFSQVVLNSIRGQTIAVVFSVAGRTQRFDGT